MENETETQPRKAKSRFVAIIGLILLIVFIAWSSIQIVKIFPSAVNSLASLADTVYNYDKDKSDDLAVISDRSIMNSGETLEVWWQNNHTSGSYIFSYQCQDGVAIDVMTFNKEFTSIACDSRYDLGILDRFQMRVDSEKSRFADVTYNVAYFRKNETSSTTSQTKNISVINVSIPEVTEEETVDNVDNVDNTDTTTPEEIVGTIGEETVTEETSEKEEVPVVVKPPVYTPPVPVYTYEIPVSNPNGHTDLVLSNLQIGFENEVQGFVNTNTVIEDLDGAIKFTVHNIGSRTSDDWVFKVTLPGGVDYVSKTQDPLKPNERAVITVAYPAITDSTSETITIQTITKRDTNENNNYLFQEVAVIK